MSVLMIWREIQRSSYREPSTPVANWGYRTGERPSQTCLRRLLSRFARLSYSATGWLDAARPIPSGGLSLLIGFPVLATATHSDASDIIQTKATSFLIDSVWSGD